MMLEQEIEKYLSGQTLCNCDSVSYRNIKNLILGFAEPREKRIAELETQIEKMKCCGNCRWEYPCSFCDDCKRLEGQIFAETLTSDNWEMK